MDLVRLLHRILGETLLLIALIGILLAIVGLIRKQAMDRAEAIFGLLYPGILDLQALLGIVLYVLLMTQAGMPLIVWPLVLHPILMILAVVMVHASRAWRNGSPPSRHWAQLAAYGLSSVLILTGRIFVA
jgi:hypothetical protein